CALFLGEDGTPTGTAAADPVEVRITIDECDALSVDVSTPGLVDVEDHPDSDLEGIEAWALLRGLIDEFEVAQGPTQTTVSMRWALV
ncbi:MAG: ATP-binding protein, partial [Actinomycetota bacterium]|nr:ATP-binding protein [Actinomycetota bacterium]